MSSVWILTRSNIRHAFRLYHMSSSNTKTSEQKSSVTMTEEELSLVHWEEWALSMEEHFHALELFLRNPNGYPMGHHR